MIKRFLLFLIIISGGSRAAEHRHNFILPKDAVVKRYTSGDTVQYIAYMDQGEFIIAATQTYEYYGMQHVGGCVDEKIVARQAKIASSLNSIQFFNELAQRYQQAIPKLAKKRVT